MRLEDEGDHPPEGTIHAWLDGALGELESERLEAHVSGCSVCASRVAEARGLIAGASRVVGLMDEKPALLVKPASTPTAEPGLSAWRLLRVTPARASIAAMLVVAVGIALTRGQLAVDSPARTVGSGALGAARHVAPLPMRASGRVPPRDSVLESAVARRLATEQPPRTVTPAPGVAIPAPSLESPTAASATMKIAEAKVLAGRASMTAQRESSSVAADQTIAGMGQLAAGAAAAGSRVAVAAKAADSAGRPAQMLRARGVAPSIGPGECYRVESGRPATWGSAKLPMILVIDSTGTDARVLTASGAETETRAFLEINGVDSTLFRLRRIGYSGSMTLASGGGTRTGVIRSASASATPAATARDARGGAPTRVTARRVACPAP